MTLVVPVALAFGPLAYVRLAGVVVQGTVVDRHETFETPTEDTWRRVYEATNRLEFRLSEVRNIQTDHDRRRRAKPTPRRRATDSEVCGDGHVPGALDEIPKAGGRSAADVAAYLCILLAEQGWERLSKETDGAELLSSVVTVQGACTFCSNSVRSG